MAQLCLQLEGAATSSGIAQAQALLPELAREAARLGEALAALNKRQRTNER